MRITELFILNQEARTQTERAFKKMGDLHSVKRREEKKTAKTEESYCKFITMTVSCKLYSTAANTTVECCWLDYFFVLFLHMDGIVLCTALSRLNRPCVEIRILVSRCLWGRFIDLYTFASAKWVIYWFVFIGNTFQLCGVGCAGSVLLTEANLIPIPIFICLHL